MEALSGPTTWPDLGWLLFVPVLFGQCALLHPAFDSRLSSSLRLAILVPNFALTLRAPWTYAFAPRERCRGLNAVLAMLSAFGGWKALEWGLVQDRMIYEWVGFDGESAMTPGGGRGEGCVDEGSRTPEKSKNGGEGARRRVGVPREMAGTDDGRIPVEREARDASWLSIAFSTAHLFASLRGTGYAFSVVPPRRRPRLSRQAFILDTLKILAWSHSLFVLCSIIISTPYTRRLAFASHLAPNLPPLAIHITIESTSYVSFGLAAWVGLVTASSLLNLLSIAIHSALLLPLPPSLHLKPFDSRQYAPLFDMPFAPRSVAEYWSRQWHRLFWRSFRFLTCDPSSARHPRHRKRRRRESRGSAERFYFQCCCSRVWCAPSFPSFNLPLVLNLPPFTPLQQSGVRPPASPLPSPARPSSRNTARPSSSSSWASSHSASQSSRA